MEKEKGVQPIICAYIVHIFHRLISLSLPKSSSGKDIADGMYLLTTILVCFCKFSWRE